jgi:S1-C subfamily serine protease
VDQLIETEEPAFRPWLGVMPYSGSFGMGGMLRELSDDLRMYMNLPDEYWDVGMLIYDVWEGSPAYDAGLRYQDFIVEVNGDLLKSIGQLEEIVYNSDKGDLLVFGLIRRDRFREIECEIGDHPDEMLMFFF